jgi:hypothetical protein
MNNHQPILPTTTITIPNLFVLITEAMNPSTGHTIILVNHQTTWSQPITPIIPGKTSMLPTSTYPMWYNIIPPFVPLILVYIQHIQLEQEDLILRPLGII